MKPLLTPEQQVETQHGETSWASKPDQCCEIRED